VERRVVIKRVRSSLTDQPEFLRLFIEEARLSLLLGHGNLVQVFDFGAHEGQHFLAMEFVDGTTAGGLLRLAKRRGFPAVPAPLAASLCVELCRGLHHAHTRADAQGQPLHIVHRDISPENVLISWEGQVKLADFGIARAALEGRAKTSPDVFRGRLEFCAPEQALGRAVDARTDLYAVGVLLATLVLGHNPVGSAEDALRIATGVAQAPAFPPWVVDHRFAELVDRCLRRDPAERFESAQALQTALQAWVSTIDTSMTVSMLGDYLAVLAPEELERRGLPARPGAAFAGWVAAWQPRERPPVEPHAPSPSGEVVSTRELVATGLWLAMVLLVVGAFALVVSLQASTPDGGLVPVVARPTNRSTPTPTSRSAPGDRAPVHEGPGEVTLTTSAALRLPSMGPTSVVAPAPTWDFVITGAPAFVSFFSSGDEVISTEPAVSAQVPAPSGAVRACAWVPSVEGVHSRAFVSARDATGGRPGTEVDLGLELTTERQARFTSLNPLQVWELKVQGPAAVLVMLGPGGGFRPAERLGSMAVVEPGSVRSFTGATFVAVSVLVSERGARKTARVSVQAKPAPRRR
jgi:hypothetical protein